MDVVLAVVSHWKEALAVVVVLGGLIFFHELGHFLMARVLGIGVRAFSLGFGPKLAAVRGGKTEYRLSLVPARKKRKMKKGKIGANPRA